MHKGGGQCYSGSSLIRPAGMTRTSLDQNEKQPGPARTPSLYAVAGYMNPQSGAESLWGRLPNGCRRWFSKHDSQCLFQLGYFFHRSRTVKKTGYRLISCDYSASCGCQNGMPCGHGTTFHHVPLHCCLFKGMREITPRAKFTLVIFLCMKSPYPPPPPHAVFASDDYSNLITC